jgi:hypothetical protein
MFKQEEECGNRKWEKGKEITRNGGVHERESYIFSFNSFCSALLVMLAYDQTASMSHNA